MSVRRLPDGRFVGSRPPYLDTAEVAEILNFATKSNAWTSKKARRALLDAGALKRLAKDGRRKWYTSPDLLRDAFPDVWPRLARLFPPQVDQKRDLFDDEED